MYVAYVLHVQVVCTYVLYVICKGDHDYDPRKLLNKTVGVGTLEKMEFTLFSKVPQLQVLKCTDIIHEHATQLTVYYSFRS